MPRVSGKLTETSVAKWANSQHQQHKFPATGCRIIYDGLTPGFGLRFTSNKETPPSFVLKYRNSKGKSRLLTIGPWGTSGYSFSVLAARNEAGNLIKQIKGDAEHAPRDPQQEREDARQAEELEKVATTEAGRTLVDLARLGLHGPEGPVGAS